MNHRLVVDQTQYGWWAVFFQDRIQVSEAFLDRRIAESLVPILQTLSEFKLLHRRCA